MIHETNIANVKHFQRTWRKINRLTHGYVAKMSEQLPANEGTAGPDFSSVPGLELNRLMRDYPEFQESGACWEEALFALNAANPFRPVSEEFFIRSPRALLGGYESAYLESTFYFVFESVLPTPVNLIRYMCFQWHHLTDAELQRCIEAVVGWLCAALEETRSGKARLKRVDKSDEVQVADYQLIVNEAIHALQDTHRNFQLTHNKLMTPLYVPKLSPGSSLEEQMFEQRLRSFDSACLRGWVDEFVGSVGRSLARDFKGPQKKTYPFSNSFEVMNAISTQESAGTNNSHEPMDVLMDRGAKPLNPVHLASPEEAFRFNDELQGALGRLSKSETEVFKLHFQGYSEKEIADRRGTQPSTTKTLKKRLRKKLAAVSSSPDASIQSKKKTSQKKN